MCSIASFIRAKERIEKSRKFQISIFPFHISIKTSGGYDVCALSRSKFDVELDEFKDAILKLRRFSRSNGNRYDKVVEKLEELYKQLKKNKRKYQIS